MRPFDLVDVFTTAAFDGNPVAVVFDCADLDSERMQRVAHWLNLSETAFLLPAASPGADYRVRFFMPTSELAFAGHPTLGSCHAWLAHGGSPRRRGVVVQECAAGLIAVRRTEDGLAFAAPPLRRSGPVEESLIGHIASLLGVARGDNVDAQWVYNGPGWVAVMLASAQAVLALRRPSPLELMLGVIGPYAEAAPQAFEVRAFFPKDGATVEDPVTGSLNASLAQWLLASGRASAPYVVSQGNALGRAGRVHISQDKQGQIWVGGGTTTCARGELEL